MQLSSVEGIYVAVYGECWFSIVSKPLRHQFQWQFVTADVLAFPKDEFRNLIKLGIDHPCLALVHQYCTCSRHLVEIGVSVEISELLIIRPHLIATQYHPFITDFSVHTAAILKKD